MVVGDTESTITGESLAIFDWYDTGCIARWSATSRVSLPSGECLRQIAPTATMANKFVAKHQTLKKTIFSKLTYGSSKPKVE